MNKKREVLQYPPKLIDLLLINKPKKQVKL
jgi:hypothetical protein